MSARRAWLDRDSFVSSALSLRRQGLSYRRIAQVLGVSKHKVMYHINPVVRSTEEARNRERQRQGRCLDCGKTISSNASYPAKRCAPCAGAERARRNRLHGAEQDST